MAGCLDALDEINNEKIDRRPYARTENLNSLVINLQRMVEEHQDKFVLVFDGIDGQREAPPTLIPALARFGEMVCTQALSSSYFLLNQLMIPARYQTSP